MTLLEACELAAKRWEWLAQNYCGREPNESEFSAVQAAIAAAKENESAYAAIARGLAGVLTQKARIPGSRPAQAADAGQRFQLICAALAGLGFKCGPDEAAKEAIRRAELVLEYEQNRLERKEKGSS